ncbi:protein Aster-A isoform X2 [Gouania willdenowi]|uniref:VASt domain-containing protein n=1 Tax=Gouania willdenowi TaxID=441366 RepID=A0A8C5DGU1_GOUWI|nr:protein Aster-A isoform X2 [Gouania willdenowi]
MNMSSSVVPQPLSIPLLTVLPPSSDTELITPSPSPRTSRSVRRSRTRAKHCSEAEQGSVPTLQLVKSPKLFKESAEKGNPSISPPPTEVARTDGEEEGRDSQSCDLFLLPPSRSWSRSPSPSRRSRWSLRSLLSRESEWDICSTASNSPRSTPGSSPSLRRRVLGGGRASESEGGGGGERSSIGGGGGSDSPLPSAPSSSSLTSAYPLASRHFSRNAKKMQSWYNVLSPTYKQRNEDFRKLFKKLPDTERLIVDYSCALQKDILLQGRLYLSENWLCFYSNIFRWETAITILLKDVTSMTKEKTAKLIPNAIQISTDNDKHFFTSFGARDRSFMMIFRLWQNALLDKSMSPKELWHIVHQCYGTELGLTSEDDDYVSPTAQHINGLLPGDESMSVSDILDLTAVSVPPSGSSPPPPLVSSGPSSPPSVGGHSGISPPSSISVLPMEVPSSSFFSSSGCRAGPDPQDLTPPSTYGSLPSTTASSPAPASFNVEEGGDSLSESTNQMPPLPSGSVGNLSSLDMPNDEDLPTDPSNSSDTQGESECDLGEVESICSNLSGRLHINTPVRMSVDKLHDLLFSADTNFIKHLFSQRHFTDLSVGEWQQDSTSGTTTRVLSYTIALNNPLGPKTAPVVETQTLHKSSSRGECFVVDSEVITSGIPYQDYFYTVHRYCLTSINKHKSRLRVSSDICYRKQPWSLVKALIEKNTWSGIEEYYRHMESEVCKLETLLQTEVSVVTTEEGTDKTLPSLRRRKRACSRRQGERDREREGIGAAGGDRGERGVGEERERRETGAQFLKLGERSRSRGHGSISTILLIVSFILVVLVALNMLLFYKLYALERAAHTLETWHSYSVTDSPLPQTSSEWAQVLQLQRQFHQAQLSKWQHILQSSVSLLDQMKQSLEKLHQGILVPDVPVEPVEPGTISESLSDT